VMKVRVDMETGGGNSDKDIPPLGSTIAGVVQAKSFHEKAGQCQDGFSFSYQRFVSFEPGCLCRHPSIRTFW
jgi:hypothetical protein